MEKSETLKSSPAGEHYKRFPIEPIQYIEANNIPYHEACIIKYVTRWRAKNGIEDLLKAKFYIERLIEVERSENSNQSIYSSVQDLYSERAELASIRPNEGLSDE